MTFSQSLLTSSVLNGLSFTSETFVLHCLCSYVLFWGHSNINNIKIALCFGFLHAHVCDDALLLDCLRSGIIFSCNFIFLLIVPFFNSKIYNDYKKQRKSICDFN